MKYRINHEINGNGDDRYVVEVSMLGLFWKCGSLSLLWPWLNDIYSTEELAKESIEQAELLNRKNAWRTKDIIKV